MFFRYDGAKFSTAIDIDFTKPSVLLIAYYHINSHIILYSVLWFGDVLVGGFVLLYK